MFFRSAKRRNYRFIEAGRTVFAEWALMLFAFQLHVSYPSYPRFAVAFRLFVASAIPFALGYATLRLGYYCVGSVLEGATSYRIHVTRLRRFHYVLLGTILATMAMNVVLHGLPPIFGFWVQTHWTTWSMDR